MRARAALAARAERAAGLRGHIRRWRPPWTPSPRSRLRATNRARASGTNDKAGSIFNLGDATRGQPDVPLPLPVYNSVWQLRADACWNSLKDAAGRLPDAAARRAGGLHRGRPGCQARIHVYDPGLALGDAPDVQVHPDARSAIRGAQVVITAGPIVKHPDPALDHSWVGDSCLLLPVDFDFYLRSELVTDADLFLVGDIGQYDYYRGQGHFQRWQGAQGSGCRADTAIDRPT